MSDEYTNMDFSWAANYPELYSICMRFNLKEISEPQQVCYKSFKSITQEGPQCGLVALAICMEKPTRETIDKLLQKAQAVGFTYNGEMFSAKDMVKLTAEHISNKVTLYDGRLDTEEIQSFLLCGGLMLVPYDCDRNHSPCQWKGHKAHWALITGIICTSSEIFVTARHGKSKNIAIWSLQELSESNAQLEEFSPDRKLQDVSYKLPDGGLSGVDGLKCKAVCIWADSNNYL